MKIKFSVGLREPSASLRYFRTRTTCGYVATLTQICLQQTLHIPQNIVESHSAPPKNYLKRKRR